MHKPVYFKKKRIIAQVMGYQNPIKAVDAA